MDSSYTGVFKPGQPRTPWKISKDFTIFHSIFWGKSIDQDEAKLRESLKKTETAPESTIPQGTFLLDFDIDKIPKSIPRRSSVLGDYAGLYESCEKYWQEVAVDQVGTGPPSLVVKRQPGVGECPFFMN